jgi:hypothetical protein
VEQLTAWFRKPPRPFKSKRTHIKHGGEEAIAWGVGSVWSEWSEALMPLVLLNSERIPAPLRSEIPDSLGIPLEFVRKQFSECYPSSSLPEIESELPIFTMLVTRPRPSNSLRNRAEIAIGNFLNFREPIICEQTASLGTAGVTVRYQDIGGYGLLTAGHVFSAWS